MAGKQYVKRSSTPIYNGPRHGRPKRNSPPVWLIILIAVLIIAVAALVFFLVSRGGEENPPQGGESSGLLSSALSGPESAPVDSLVSSATAEPTASPTPVPTEAPLTPPPERVPQGVPEQLSALLRVGDTGYEYYNFNEDVANSYITAICEADDVLGDLATVYDMVIPTSMDIMLPESYIEENGINSDDQKKAINYITESIQYNNPNVKTVPLFDALKVRNNEYIYFRTDHHWTQLGAYYAYVEFCKAKGIEPVPLDGFDKDSYEGFLGTFYSDNPNAEMEANPDTVEAYRVRADTDMMFIDMHSGERIEGWPVINDGDQYGRQELYYIFAAADEPYEELYNRDLDDGSACVVLKESFGNCFVPFLLSHYQTVYVVDYRYYDGNLRELVQESGATDVIFLNNISMTRNSDLVESLNGLF